MLGAISAYVGGLLNGLIMRVTDAFLTFPVAAGVLLLNRLFVSDINELFAPPTQFHAELTGLGLNTIMLTLILFSWMPYARLINANVQQLKRADFVLAARSVGAKPGRILFRHLLPNAIAPAIVLLARDVGGMVILDAAFAFIGLEGTVEWGQLLVANRDWIIGIGGNPFTYWWVFVPITLALLLFGIGWNLLGDGLNRALNPRKR